MEWLAMQQEAQEKLRVALSRGPILPREIISAVLDQIPTTNKLKLNWGGKVVYVDGLLPHVIFNPSLSSLIHEEPFDTEWTVEDIAKQRVKLTVLEEAVLIKHIKLRAKASIEDFSDFRISDLRPSLKYSLQWKEFEFHMDQFNMKDFVDLIRPCLPHLEELVVFAGTMTSSSAVAPLQESHLKGAELTFNAFSVLFNSGILNYITNLRLRYIDTEQFSNRKAFKKSAW